MAGERTLQITQEDYQKLVDFIDAGQQGRPAYPGKKFEDGARAMLEYLDGETTIDEIVGGTWGS